MWEKNHTNHAGEKFCLKFPDTTCPPRDTISKLVRKKIQTHSILTDRKPLENSS
jgi:hypothetical protein